MGRNVLKTTTKQLSASHVHGFWLSGMEIWNKSEFFYFGFVSRFSDISETEVI